MTELTALALAGALAILVPVLAWTDADVSGRALAAVLFTLLVPGAPLAIALRLPDGRVTATLAVGLSLSAAALTAAVAVTAGWWSPTGSAVVSAAAAVAVMPWAVDAAAAQSRRAARPAPDDAGAGPRARAPDPLVRMLGLGAVAAALGLWWTATDQINASRAGATGLAGVAPLTYWLALAVLAAVIAVFLLRPALDHVVLGAAVLALAAGAYLLVNVSDGAAGIGAGWVHVGFIDYISRTGEMADGIDARFSWPGFLAGAAQLVSLGGLGDSAPLMLAAPAVYTALALAPTWLIGRLVTGSDRLAWVSVLIALVVNWYQQDYFSGQATGYVLYVSMLAILLWAFCSADVPPVRGGSALRWMRAVQRIPGRPGSATQSVPAWVCTALEIALLVMTAALVVTHQLTPIPMLAALLWFVLAGATRWRTLWLVGGAMFVGWFSYGATDYWIGNLQTVFEDLGQVSQSVGSGTTGRVTGEPLYQRMQLVRIAWTGLLGCTALAGLWLLRRERTAALLAGLAVLPFTVVVAQSYGGEAVIRCALYATPVLSPLAAVAVGRAARRVLAPVLDVRRSTGTRSARRVPLLVAHVAVTEAVLLAAAMLTVTRGLNTSFEHVTPTQVHAARALLAAVPDGATIATAASVGPLPLGRVGEVRITGLLDGRCAEPPMECLRAAIGPDGGGGPDFVYITDGQDAQGALQGGQPRGWTRQLVAVLQATGGYATLLDTDDVVVLQRTAPYVQSAPGSAPAPATGGA